MTVNTVEECLGKKIKVTYDAYEGEDVYYVSRIDIYNEVVMKRPRGGEFTVSPSWFTRTNTGRNIEIIN